MDKRKSGVKGLQGDIVKSLNALQDIKYRDFQAGLIPTVDVARIIGVRTPALRAMARDMRDNSADFLKNLPHGYFEENQLHAFIISNIRDFELAASAVDKFLPYVDNWATCDQMSPRVFAKNTDKLLPYIKKWIKSQHIYTVRFAVLCLMRYFLDDKFDTKYVDMVANIKSDEYYINMMRAWYFATAVAKRWDKILPYFKGRALDPWTHNRAIQKALESYRVTTLQKSILKPLKLNG
ncbi:MAG: DNA alkylation repair protein [Alphaproteobacteria bacterium]|nr:DNA alkylation repair protein [Alphaproteobacteria bacterium]MBR4806213.1 DNA alkylation repair protein [Alphaproteobacteria bacterium]